ncbi:MAG: putative transporter, superfamily [Cereibacter sp.]|jgi:drug/metabolite transporter (DMT)-like permease|nr:putative transporter, superfamily [Cereibacter sp.]
MMQTAAPSRSRTLEGVGWMLASGLSFVGVTGVVRHLGTDLPAAQSAFLRFALGLIFVLPALRSLLRDGLPTGALRLFAWRGAFHTVAVIFWFYAMARISVAEVTAIGYLNPVLVTLGAALFFGERLAWRRMLAIAVALVGTAIVLRPGLRDLGAGHLSQLAAATFFAGSYLMVKRLSGIAGAGSIVAMMSLCVTLGLLPFALWVWAPVTLTQIGWLALVAACATSGHYCMTRAFRAAPLAVTQPVTFLQLIWATLLGALVFGEGVDVFVLLGGAVIIGAISYITWRESRLKPQVAPAAMD